MHFNCHSRNCSWSMQHRNKHKNKPLWLNLKTTLHFIELFRENMMGGRGGLQTSPLFPSLSCYRKINPDFAMITLLSHIYIVFEVVVVVMYFVCVWFCFCLQFNLISRWSVTGHVCLCIAAYWVTISTFYQPSKGISLEVRTFWLVLTTS